jgi:hypothetical protein
MLLILYKRSLASLRQMRNQVRSGITLELKTKELVQVMLSEPLLVSRRDNTNDIAEKYYRHMVKMMNRGERSSNFLTHMLNKGQPNPSSSLIIVRREMLKWMLCMCCMLPRLMGPVAYIE